MRQERRRPLGWSPKHTALVQIDALKVSFRSSEEAGQISYDYDSSSGIVIVPLLATKLKMASYTCEGDNSGRFGYLSEIKPDAIEAQSARYKKTIGDKTYGLTVTLPEKCYEAGLFKEFSETVPKAIVDSLAAMQ